MVIVAIDKRIRKVSLTGQEIEFIIEALEYQPHNVYEFFNCDKLVKKFNKALNRRNKK